LRDQPVLLRGQRVEHVLLIDLHILALDGDLLRGADGLQRFLREFFHVHANASPRGITDLL